jgi:hypothetical protein
LSATSSTDRRIEWSPFRRFYLTLLSVLLHEHRILNFDHGKRYHFGAERTTCLRDSPGFCANIRDVVTLVHNVDLV